MAERYQMPIDLGGSELIHQVTALAKHPEHIEGVAERTYRLWGHLIREDTGMTAVEYIEVVRSRAVTDSVPLTLIALEGDALVGSVSLKKHEASSAPDLTPWIGGLLVDEAMRGKGLGKALLVEAEAAAARLGYPWLYLSCERHVEPFYERLGWTLLKRAISCGDEVAIMKKKLDTQL